MIDYPWPSGIHDTITSSKTSTYMYVYTHWAPTVQTTKKVPPYVHTWYLQNKAIFEATAIGMKERALL